MIVFLYHNNSYMCTCTSVNTINNLKKNDEKSPASFWYAAWLTDFIYWKMMPSHEQYVNDLK